MYVLTEPDGRLIVTSTSRFFDWLLILGSALCTVPTLRGLWRGTFDLHESTPLVGSAFFLLCFAICFERTRFEFDPARGLVHWVRKGIFSSKTGLLPFNQVTSVVLQTSLGSDATCPSSRLALITTQGELPLSRTYAGGTGEEYELIAGKIRLVLKMSPITSDIVLDSVRAAAAQGRTIDAIRLLRLYKNMTLAEAQSFIDRLK
jgi:hypothetical protein